ncbi:filamentous hemagglutinin N-terminal domain-containing protein [Xenorhabdus sp. TH1]|uniref:filamentous hemagglutinin N-terminal domain-containing protein n=1 Tax=Xenorhabdus sp. TH1 TaxID=3130166 RepID=UPI0030D148D8
MKTNIKLALFFAGLCSLNSSFANPIISDNSGTQVQNINNIPVVNISTPDNRGISYNTYKDFNVDTQGAVLNNSLNQIRSQLAGQINKNPNLNNPAKLIINEVTSGNQSQLNGLLEIAGKKADVLISNPNGITANGGSFSNAVNITITTGKPALDPNGQLMSIVETGKITIGEKGLDGYNGGDSVAIVSKALELNGKIRGKDLFVLQGSNDDINKPALAIDTKALGGMYANNIVIVSSKAGVGVNLNKLS